ncbi:MAG: hypothetical protein ABIR29_03820 [Chthoniobacterales bacterium]
MSEEERHPSAQFEAVLASCQPQDFDGHTEFARLTPEERLEWLYQAASFVYEFKGKASDGGVRSAQEHAEAVEDV